MDNKMDENKETLDQQSTEENTPAEEVQETEEMASPVENSNAEDSNVEDSPAEEQAESPKSNDSIAEKADEKPVKKPHKRILVGKVLSNKSDKTITVAVVRQISHPVYKKYYKVSKKFMAHDEQNECNIGDTVRIKESRPLSRNKRWEMIEILERAK